MRSVEHNKRLWRQMAWLRSVGLSLAIALLAALGWNAYRLFFGIHAQTARTTQLLYSTSIDHFEVNQATEADALEALKVALKRAKPTEEIVIHNMTMEEFRHESLPIVELRLEFNSTGQPQIREIPTTRTFDNVIHEQPLEILPVSFSVTDVPAIDACRYVAAFFNSKVRIRGHEVQFYPERPRRLFGPLVHRTFRAVPNIFTDDPMSDPLPQTLSGGLDVRPFLQRSGVSFCHGARSEFFPDDNELHLFLPQSEIDLLEGLIPSDEIRPTWRERLKAVFFP